MNLRHRVSRLVVAAAAMAVIGSVALPAAASAQSVIYQEQAASAAARVGMIRAEAGALAMTLRWVGTDLKTRLTTP